MKVQGMRNQFGLGMLETAMVMVILISLFLSAVGVFDYVSKGSLVTHVIDQFIDDQDLKPFELQGVTLRFADERIRQELPIILDNVESNLLASFARDGLASDAYSIEAEFIAFEIDTHSGEPLRILRYPNARFSRGHFSIPEEVRQRIDFDAEYSAMLARGGMQYASPSGLYANVGSQDRFLPLTPIIAIRAAVSLEGTFTGSTLQTIGVSDNPAVFDLKAVTLRGEVG